MLREKGHVFRESTKHSIKILSLHIILKIPRILNSTEQKNSTGISDSVQYILKIIEKHTTPMSIFHNDNIQDNQWWE